jgi:DNA repair exonuclease SbcCD ATPase subunit
MSSRTLCFAVALALAACAQAPEIADSPPAAWNAPGAGWLERQPEAAAAVDASAQQLARDVRPSEDGRTYLLELYQRAIEERDALASDARALTAELERARATLAERDRTQAELMRRIAELESERERRAAESFELAARLTTAQIRRLQVEKALLEARLAEAAASEPPTGAKAEKP